MPPLRTRQLPDSDFARLWAGQTVSVAGTMFGALTLTALIYLHATAFQVGLLAVAQGSSVVLVTPIAGVWVDRLPRRPVLISTDLGRALLLLSVPLAAAFDALAIGQLYLVAFLFGALDVLFRVAYRSYLPSLVPPEQLLEANASLAASESVAEIGAPALGGTLVQTLGAPLTVLADALTFVWSAACLTSIRRRESRLPRETRESTLREAQEGFRAVWQDRVLRALVATAGTSSFFGGFFQALYSLFLLRELGFSPLLVGVTIGAGGLGSLGGALLAGRMNRSLGIGRTLVLTKLMPLSLLIPLAGGPRELAFVMIVAAQALGDPFWTVYEISAASLLQSSVQERLLGRVVSCLHLVEAGLLPVGALIAGILAEAIGVRETLLIAAVAGPFSAIWLVLSPIPRLERMTSAPN